MKSFVMVMLAFLASGPALADELPKGFVPSDLNASIPPVSEGGGVTFRIVPQDCSDRDYGNGSGENDCLNGSTKNLIQLHSEPKLGESLEYKFDVWVEPKFSYYGYMQSDTRPFGGEGWDTRLRVAGWEGNHRKNFIDMLKLDGRNGLAFRFQQCQSPKDFGNWVSVSLKVRSRTSRFTATTAMSVTRRNPRKTLLASHFTWVLP